MIKLFGADLSTPVIKVRFVANYLKLDYEYIRVSIRDQENKKPEFLAMNPSGKVPAMNDNGFFLFESGAIIKYLSGQENSSLYPSDLKERAVVDQWVDFVNLHILMAMNRVAYNVLFAPIVPGAQVDENSLADGRKFLERFLPIVDKEIQKQGYLAGKDLTIADFSLLAALEPAEVTETDLSLYTAIVEWRNKLREKEWYRAVHANYGETLEKFKAAMQGS